MTDTIARSGITDGLRERCPGDGLEVKRSGLRRKTPLRRGPFRRSEYGTEGPPLPGMSKTADRPSRQSSAKRSQGAASRYKARERFPEYMLAVKLLPCLMAGVWGRCDGPVEADHAGGIAGDRRGTGRKAPDSTCIPLCKLHHSSRFPHAWLKDKRRAWLDAAIEYTRAVLTAHGVDVPEDGDTPHVIPSVYEAERGLHMAVESAS
jgi:hypothetical protein